MRREAQFRINLVIATGQSDAVGYANWSALAGTTEIADLIKLYGMGRLVAVCARYLPMNFTGTQSGQLYCPLAGAIAHDPTGNVFSTTAPADFSDLTMLPQSKLWAATGMGTAKWGSLTARPMRNKTVDLDLSADPALGTWADSQRLSYATGRTYFSAFAPDSSTAATDQTVLTVVLTAGFEFREPTPEVAPAVTRMLTCVNARVERKEAKAPQPSLARAAAVSLAYPLDFTIVEQKERPLPANRKGVG